jgi:hypothetical protein
MLLKQKKKSRKKLSSLFTPHSINTTKKKPAWTIHAVMKIKELHPDYGCRKISHLFNQTYYINLAIK